MGDFGRSGADAPSGLRPFGAEPAAQSQAEPLVPNAVHIVLLCDETGDNAICQEIDVVADLEAFAAYAKHEYADARGDPERGYLLHDKDGNDLGFTLVTREMDVLTAQAIEARQRQDRETGLGPKDESAVAESDAPKTHRQDTPSPPEDM